MFLAVDLVNLITSGDADARGFYRTAIYGLKQLPFRAKIASNLNK